MTDAANSLLTTFDGLPEDDQRLVAVEILRRTAHIEYGSLDDETLDRLADERFVALDDEESADENP
jgi:hypothetical protein